MRKIVKLSLVLCTLYSTSFANNINEKKVGWPEVDKTIKLNNEIMPVDINNQIGVPMPVDINNQIGVPMPVDINNQIGGDDTLNLDNNKRDKFLKLKKERLEKERNMIDSRIIPSVNNNIINNEKPLDSDSNNSLKEILKELSNIKMEMGKKDNNYNGIVNALLDGEVLDQKVKEDNLNKEVQNQEDEEILKLMLPIPQKAVNIGNKFILFALYKEENLTKSPSDINKQATLIESTGLVGSKKKFNLNDIEYNDKLIKIEEGYRFGDWELSNIEMNYITYKNLKTNEIVRKFY